MHPIFGQMEGLSIRGQLMGTHTDHQRGCPTNGQRNSTTNILVQFAPFQPPLPSLLKSSSKSHSSQSQSAVCALSKLQRTLLSLPADPQKQPALTFTVLKALLFHLKDKPLSILV